jgi:ferric-dicitrate binding protein FerR (iron transport regulator)
MKEMKEDELEALLQKYYNGETTLAEEKLLKAYLSQRDTSSERKAERQWFIGLQLERQTLISKDFEKQLEDKLGQVAFQSEVQAKQKFWSALPYRIAALLAIALGLSFAGYLTFTNKPSQWVEITTVEKESKQVSLPDGSKLWLNEASAIRYARQLEAASQREVWLEGEAYFEVAHHPKKPFIVHLAGTTTQVLGTSFNIRGYPGESTAEVGVITGKVSFAAQANELPQRVILQSGYGAVFDKKTITLQKSKINSPNLLAWKTHQLLFEDAPLHEVITTLERYFAIDIVLKNPTLANCRFKGKFKQASLEEVLEVIGVSMNFSAEQKDGQYIFLGKGCL